MDRLWDGRTTQGYRRASLVVAVVAATGCGGAGAPGGTGAEPALSRIDSAGVEIVTNGSATTLLTLAEDLRIGVVEGQPVYQFHDVAAVDVGEDGTVAVFNGGSLSLRVYDAGGRFLREIGRQGEGPGEFRGGSVSQYSLRMWGDTLLIAEGLGRSVSYTVFDTTGTLLHTVPGLASPYFFRDETVVPAGEGRLRFTTSTMPGGSWDVEGQAKQTELVVREIDLASGEMGPELARVPGRVVLSTGRGTPFPVALPFFDPNPLAALVPDGVLASPAGEYEVRLLSPDGELRRIVRRGYTPRPLTDRVRADFERETREAASGVVAERLLARSPRVSVLPPIDRLATTRQGGFWVRRKDLTDDPLEDMRRARLTFDGADPAPARWDGFSRDGAYLGTIELPVGFTPHAWGRDWVAGVVEDELEVEHVVRLAMGEPAS